mmetsp:Transcript_150339/g.483147  ORF Transcript_150339/g.483147 Transcript_150339/m.483147 type:complete len:210 (-) Transcript_150339:60-689(-)
MNGDQLQIFPMQIRLCLTHTRQALADFAEAAPQLASAAACQALAEPAHLGSACLEGQVVVPQIRPQHGAVVQQRVQGARGEDRLGIPLRRPTRSRRRGRLARFGGAGPQRYCCGSSGGGGGGSKGGGHGGPADDIRGRQGIQNLRGQPCLDKAVNSPAHTLLLVRSRAGLCSCEGLQRGSLLRQGCQQLADVPPLGTRRSRLVPPVSSR